MAGMRRSGVEEELVRRVGRAPWGQISCPIYLQAKELARTERRELMEGRRTDGRAREGLHSHGPS